MGNRDASCYWEVLACYELIVLEEGRKVAQKYTRWFQVANLCYRASAVVKACPWLAVARLHAR
jgi:hypothetical protein